MHFIGMQGLLLALQLVFGYSNEYRNADSGLTHFPPDVPRNVTTIFLQRNQIQSVSPTDFEDMHNLRSLYLFDNMLTIWPDVGSAVKPNLELMQLGNNLISDLTPNQTQGLVSLQRIKLYMNRFTKFPDLGDAKKSLTILSFKDNFISYVDKDMFKGMEKLTTLVLAGNQISTMPDMHFLNLSNFETIDLKNNPLAAIFPWGVGPLNMTKTT